MLYWKQDEKNKLGDFPSKSQLSLSEKDTRLALCDLPLIKLG